MLRCLKKLDLIGFLSSPFVCRSPLSMFYIVIGKLVCFVEFSRFSNWFRSTKILPPIIFTLRYCFTNALILFLLIGKNSR